MDTLSAYGSSSDSDNELEWNETCSNWNNSASATTSINDSKIHDEDLQKDSTRIAVNAYNTKLELPPPFLASDGGKNGSASESSMISWSTNYIAKRRLRNQNCAKYVVPSPDPPSVESEGSSSFAEWVRKQPNFYQEDQLVCRDDSFARLMPHVEEWEKQSKV